MNHDEKPQPLKVATPVGDKLPKVKNRRDRRAVASELRKYIKRIRRSK